MKKKTYAVLLAAGEGKRMESNLPKVAHFLKDKTLLEWCFDSLFQTNVDNILCVISPTHDVVKKIISDYNHDHHKNIQFCFQDPPLGTGHAVLCAFEFMKTKKELFFPINNLENELTQKQNTNILISYGDTPGIQSQTYNNFIHFHEQGHNHFSILSFLAKNPFGYGRILMDNKNHFVGIREEKDCNTEEKKIQICNSGILMGHYSCFEEILPSLKNKNAQQEYYLTDVPMIAVKKKNQKVSVLLHQNENELLGINTKDQLQAMENFLSSQ